MKGERVMMKKISKEEANEELKKGYGAAKNMLENEDKLEKFLQRLEKKLKYVPVAGDKLSMVPTMASLIKSYVKKEYTEIPIGSIIAILSALIYFVSPVDLIPDAIPVIGLVDDAAVVAACLNFVNSDLEEYSNWREKNGKLID